MEPIPSNTTQLTTSDVPADDPIMSDKLALDRVEQVVVNVLDEVVSDVMQLPSLAIVVCL